MEDCKIVGPRSHDEMCYINSDGQYRPFLTGICHLWKKSDFPLKGKKVQISSQRTSWTNPSNASRRPTRSLAVRPRGRLVKWLASKLGELKVGKTERSACCRPIHLGPKKHKEHKKTSTSRSHLHLYYSKGLVNTDSLRSGWADDDDDGELSIVSRPYTPGWVTA